MQRSGHSPTENEVDEMARLYQEGLSLDEVGQRLGFVARTVQRHLSDQGVSLRDTHGRDVLVGCSRSQQPGGHDALRENPRTPSAPRPDSKPRGRRVPGRVHAARKRLGPDVVQQLVVDYEAGESTAALAESYGLGKGTVLSILEEHGDRMRGQGLLDEQLAEAARLYNGRLAAQAAWSSPWV